MFVNLTNVKSWPVPAFIVPGKACVNGVLLLTEKLKVNPEPFIIPPFAILTVIGSDADNAEDVNTLPEDKLTKESSRKSIFHGQLFPPLAVFNTALARSPLAPEGKAPETVTQVAESKGKSLSTKDVPEVVSIAYRISFLIV